MKIKKLVFSFLVVIIVAVVGSLFTSSGTNSEWYQEIRPSITPPNYVFPIVWNILFFLIALSLYFSLAGSKNKKTTNKIMLVYGINFVLNILWSLFYFKMRNPLLAFFDIVLILASIVVIMIYSWKIDKKASYLLIPYLLWVGFASVLNFLTI